MGLKTFISEHMTSNKTLTVTITAVIVTLCVATLFSACTPPQETRQLIIPSELEPEAVLPDFGGDQYNECVYESGEDSDTCRVIQYFIEADELGKGFVKGYARGYWEYALKNGDSIGIVHTLLDIYVLKYETLQGAETAFNLFSERIDMTDIIFDGVKIKGDPREATYMLQSNNFVIFLIGWNEACRDALGRIIELYSVPITSNN